MKKTSQRKLVLGKQTIRSLQQGHLQGAVGGLPTGDSDGDGGGSSVGGSRCNGCSFYSVSTC